jgi:hypothetical protein
MPSHGSRSLLAALVTAGALPAQLEGAGHSATTGNVTLSISALRLTTYLGGVWQGQVAGVADDGPPSTTATRPALSRSAVAGVVVVGILVAGLAVAVVLLRHQRMQRRAGKLVQPEAPPSRGSPSQVQVGPGGEPEVVRVRRSASSFQLVMVSSPSNQHPTA